MSGRTKLLITALFLVLLAIPVVYIVLAWNPQAPLRFRTLSQGTPSEGGAYGKRTLEVEVRNTTAFRIHLLTATMHRSDFPHLPETLVGELNLDPPEVLPPDEGEFTGVISSHSTWRGRVLLIYPPSSEIPIKDLTVRYVAVSKVKKKIVDWYWNDVYTRLPPSLHPHLPQPSLSWHETKLDDSSP